MIDDHPEGEEGVRELLETHFINEEGFEALLENDYESFLQARKERIREAIETRVGLDIDWDEGEEQ